MNTPINTPGAGYVWKWMHFWKKSWRYSGKPRDLIFSSSSTGVYSGTGSMPYSIREIPLKPMIQGWYSVYQLYSFNKIDAHVSGRHDP